MVDYARWEYRIRVVPTHKSAVLELNRLGRAGWELAAAVGVGELGAVDEIWCFFKRPSGGRAVKADA